MATAFGLADCLPSSNAHRLPSSSLTTCQLDWEPRHMLWGHTACLFLGDLIRISNPYSLPT